MFSHFMLVNSFVGNMMVFQETGISVEKLKTSGILYLANMTVIKTSFIRRDTTARLKFSTQETRSGLSKNE